MQQLKRELSALFFPGIKMKIGSMEIEVNLTMENCLMMLYVSEFDKKKADNIKPALISVLSDCINDTRQLICEINKIKIKEALNVANVITHFFLKELSEYSKEKKRESKLYPHKKNRPTPEQSFLEMFAFLIRASKGSFTMDYLLSITPALFFEHLRTYGFVLREESEEGQKINDKIIGVQNIHTPIDEDKITKIKNLVKNRKWRTKK